MERILGMDCSERQFEANVKAICDVNGKHKWHQVSTIAFLKGQMRKKGEGMYNSVANKVDLHYAAGGPRGARRSMEGPKLYARERNPIMRMIVLLHEEILEMLLPELV